jgi:hypothetical protein
LGANEATLQIDDKVVPLIDTPGHEHAVAAPDELMQNGAFGSLADVHRVVTERRAVVSEVHGSRRDATSAG